MAKRISSREVQLKRPVISLPATIILILFSIFICFQSFLILYVPSGSAWYTYLIRALLGFFLVLFGSYLLESSLTFLIIRKYPDYSLHLDIETIAFLTLCVFAINGTVLIMSILKSFFSAVYLQPPAIPFFILINVIFFFVISNQKSEESIEEEK